MIHQPLQRHHLRKLDSKSIMWRTMHYAADIITRLHPNTFRSLKPNNNPSYTLHPIALLAAFREIRSVEPVKKPARPRDYGVEGTVVR
jgi:hypothetical protein